MSEGFGAEEVGGQDDRGARAFAGCRVDVEHRVELAQALVDAPEADAAARREGARLAPRPREADAVVAHAESNGGVEARAARHLHAARACVLANVREQLAHGLV